jgi:hypothetical protein
MLLEIESCHLYNTNMDKQLMDIMNAVPTPRLGVGENVFAAQALTR